MIKGQYRFVHSGSRARGVARPPSRTRMRRVPTGVASLCRLSFRNLVMLEALFCLGWGISAELKQFTPDQAEWSTFATKPFESGTNTAHDPHGVGWISSQAWDDARWDGTIYNPSKMSRAEFASAICPSVDRLRGIREVFYERRPFADIRNPTKAEVDEWHRIAINHARALIGYTSKERQVKKDHCMFARALWGDERKFTTMWDEAYPGKTGSAAGPCQGSGNSHCGATFIPNATDQAPYLPEGHAACRTQAGSEGIFSGPKSNIPWSLKWSRGLCNTLMAEGFWGGHVGPWFHRERFGLSFWDPNPGNNNNNAILRAKWTGKLMSSLYCNPADADCDPDNTGPGTGTEPTPAPPENTPAPTGPSCCQALVPNNNFSYNGNREICISASVTGDCSPQVRYNAAKSACESNNARLCTLEELEAKEARRIGCGLRKGKVWTSTPCKRNGFFIAKGYNGGGKRCKRPRKSQHLAGILCCAEEC